MILVIRVWRDQGANVQYSVPDEKLEETRTHIAEMIGAWSSASEWSQIDEWTWRKTDGERIEIVGIGGERDYSLTEVKRAFWETFHEAGEIWFSYLSSPDQNTSYTEEWWQTFQEHLLEMGPEPDIISLGEAGKEMVKAARRVRDADVASVLNLREVYLTESGTGEVARDQRMYPSVTDDPLARWGGRLIWSREPSPLDASEA